MAKTWADGSYKFPYMDFEKYNAVNYADDVMGGDITKVDEAADMAEKVTGVSREFIAGTENSEKTAKKVEEIEKEGRRSRKYKRLEGKEEYIEYFYNLGSTVNMLAGVFDVSPTQMANYIRESGIKRKKK